MCKTNKNTLNNDSGFNLIEIIITISVLSIGILGLLHAFPSGIKTQTAIELKSIANQLAQEKQEELSSIVYIDIPVGTIEDNERLSDDVTSPFYKFRRTTVIELVDENFQPNDEDVGLKKITTTVAWPTPFNGATDQVSLVTVISKR